MAIIRANVLMILENNIARPMGRVEKCTLLTHIIIKLWLND